jgi:DNA-binding CsgD family transcriptional regulator
MIIISPECRSKPILLPGHLLTGMIEAIGTERYARACFDAIYELLDADHWLLYRFSGANCVTCIATHSRMHESAARQNIEAYTKQHYVVDPALIALQRRGTQSDYVAKMAIEDIHNEQYRRCFEQTGVRERLSLFSRAGADLYQVSIFRGLRRQGVTPAAMAQFSALATLILRMALKHENLCGKAPTLPQHLDLRKIEQLLSRLAGALSTRERQICSRVVAGMTIEGTALDLAIKRSSVITYRQRAYQKLGVSRQNELIALINNIRTSGDAAKRLL